MKKRIIAFLICFFGLNTSFALAQDVLSTLEKLNNMTYDFISSFLSYPANHKNTLNVHEKLESLYKFYREEDNNMPYIDNYKVRQYYDEVKKHKELIEAFVEITGNVAGYIESGIDDVTFEVLMKPIFNQFGWCSTKLSISCPDIEFYEYSKDGFKMLLTHNTRPAADYRANNGFGIYYDNEVNCYTYWKEFRKTNTFCRMVVRGGLYRVVQYKDDTNTTYHRLTKATSKRIN